MLVKQFKPMSSPSVLNTKPFVMVLPNTGCGLGNCHCSDGWKLSVSNGKVGLLVTFDNKKEFEQYLQV